MGMDSVEGNEEVFHPTYCYTRTDFLIGIYRKELGKRSDATSKHRENW